MKLFIAVKNPWQKTQYQRNKVIKNLFIMVTSNTDFFPIDNVKLLDSPEIAGMPNKRTKLDYQTNSPNKSPIQFPQAS